MVAAQMLVFSSPSSPDREAEYDAWYDGIHLPEVCDVPGVVGARRYKLHATQMFPGVDVAGHRNLAVYELETSDLQDVMDEILARSQDGRMRMSDAIDQVDNPPLTVVFSA